jgi:RimJ/RimL family protein N-acetyltransferase
LEGYNENIGKFKLVPLDKNSEEDFKICKEIFTDESIMKHSTIFNQKIGTEEQIEKIFNIYTKSWETDNIGEYKILDEKNNILGIAGFIISDRNNKGEPNVLNLGCYLNKERGMQFTTDITSLLTKYIFNYIKNIDEIITYSKKNNHLSHLIMHKLSYNHLGNLKFKNMDISFFSFKKIFYSKNITKKISSLKTVVNLVINSKKQLNEKYINYLKL